jgi:hypothetical protein
MRAVLVFRYVHVKNEQFVPFEIAVRFPQAHLPQPDRLDLRPRQRNPGDVLLIDEVLVECFFVFYADGGVQG